MKYLNKCVCDRWMDGRCFWYQPPQLVRLCLLLSPLILLFSSSELSPLLPFMLLTNLSFQTKNPHLCSSLCAAPSSSSFFCPLHVSVSPRLSPAALHLYPSLPSSEWGSFHSLLIVREKNENTIHCGTHSRRLTVMGLWGGDWILKKK